MNKCTHCHKKFSTKDDTDTYDLQYLFNRSDRFGMESLTEYQQAFVEGSICGECLEILK
jgi:hypothetical protein